MTQEDSSHHLSGMYKSWFLDYASYVILERAVPHINDGLKPVQRRILHSMKRLDDGRYNKVANIVGHTMQFHPHGDSSIGDALVQLGQKDLLIDCQGNWGNILTGDGAAAPRYIEARLSKFALDTVFNPKTTSWKASYDGRNKEPITLPIKFPLLLAQGVEGIAVGLSSKILPHNFNELIDASISYLKEQPFVLYPDFQTGGFIDISKYNDGERGGSVKVRARINKLDTKTLVVSEVPFGRTTSTIIESILKANDKGKIKIKKVDDNTAKDVEILIHLAPGVSPDKTIDALYAFTDCEINLSPNCCIIRDNKPHFLCVSEVLRHCTDETLNLLRRELEIEKEELEEALFFTSLEKIFIENRIYKDKLFEEAVNMDAAVSHVSMRLEVYKKDFIREIVRDDILRLMEIKMGRILKFNADKCNETLLQIQKDIARIQNDLENIVKYTIDWFKSLKRKYGKDFPRKTEIRSFDTIEASKVAEANEKLYINRAEGFVGTALKKDEFVCNCSSIDDIILFYKDGIYKVVRVQEKMFVGKNLLHINVFKRNDTRTIYNVVYRDGKYGSSFIKRFSIPSLSRDKDYCLTKGTEGSKILYFSVNPNGEAETIKVTLKPKLRQKLLVFDKHFSDILIKGRSSIGNLLTKADVHKIVLKHKGSSTLGGLSVWFDADICRLNTDERGLFLGEFSQNDEILVRLSKGVFYTSNFDMANRYEEQIEQIEKFNPNKIWTLVYWDDDQKYTYIKRFVLESSTRKQSFLGDNPMNKVLLLTDEKYPNIQISFADGDSFREAQQIDANTFALIKGFRAKGKRISQYKVGEVVELEPTYMDETDNETDIEEVDSWDDSNEDREPTLFD